VSLLSALPPLAPLVVVLKQVAPHTHTHTPPHPTHPRASLLPGVTAAREHPPQDYVLMRPLGDLAAVVEHVMRSCWWTTA
jgi:hypothetical protein